jgi:UDP-N-acetylmuramoylalanine--D-glutamate ligase
VLSNRNKSAIILGLAASGEAAAKMLLSEGRAVTIVDEGGSAEIHARAESLGKLGAVVSVGASRIPAGKYDICIVSPGISPGSSILGEVESRGISILPEFELGWSRARCPVLAITGSNGKSTCVKLCVETMAQAGLKAFAAGNYGPPVSQVVLDHPDADWLVIEVSSFQLEHLREFHPRAAVLLNVFPNHLDRHIDFQRYFALKARIFSRMGKSDLAAVSEADYLKITEILKGEVPLVSFGLAESADYRFYGHRVVARPSGKEIQFENTAFDNEVLGLTAAAAAAAMEACRVPFSCLERAARDYKPLPHRMEQVGVLNDVHFVDDSKATNLASMLAALKMTKGYVRLIAGGLSKNESYAPAAALLAGKASGIYLIGKAADEMAAAWQDAVPCHRCVTLENAVARAWEQAMPGETILLSPACASFDQFRSFEERGELFCRLFQKLIKE